MLSSRITVLRRASGLSQSQLAQMLHVGPSAVGMYEQGRRTPNIDILIAMSKQFGVSLDYLLTGSEFQTDPDKTSNIQTALQCPCSACGCRRRCGNIQQARR